MDRLEALEKRVHRIEKHLGVKTMSELVKLICDHREANKDPHNISWAKELADKLIAKGYCVLEKLGGPRS